MDVPENLSALFGRRITPFIGSGMVRDAGVVDVGQLARALAAAADVDDFGGDLTKVVHAAEAEHEPSDVQQMVREIVLAQSPRSTPALRALATCARGWFILTTNYDDAVEVSVEAAGLKPVPLLRPEVWTAGSPAADEVFVVHIHGRAVGGGALILPGHTTNVEAGQTRYVAFVTHLLVQEPVVYFGFSFGDGETALQSAVAFMDTHVAGAAEQILVIQAPDLTEAARRFSHLPNFSVATYPGSHVQASRWAQMLSGRAEAPNGCLEKTSTIPPPSWLQPRMFAAALNATPGELDQLVFGVDHPYGTPSASSLEARELFKARHALLIASPGMGKSELFAHLAREDGALPVLVLKASGIAAELDPARSPAQVFAAALLRGAWASTEGVPRPTLEALHSGPLAFLVDGFDEVRQGRGAVAEVITEAAREWPQHHVVVASRPVPECRDLIADGFAPYRLWPSNGWAKEYLNARGVENDARTKMEQARGFDDLIAIPLFARPVADRLLSGELPERPLDLLVDAQRVAAAREEEREVIDGSLFDWLCGLAVALMLRGRTEATPAELSEVAGDGALSSEELRERFVRASLLAELPDVAAFPRQTLQEALCAHVILEQPDVAAAVREIAIDDIDGESAIRDDMEFTLDLVFENANREQRAALCEIDEPRWARTVVSRGSAADAGAALDVLIAEAGDGYLGLFADGLVRSARSAVRAIARNWPEAVQERQAVLLDLSRSANDAQRTTAIVVLGATTTAPTDVRERVIEMVRDPQDLIGRFAVDALARWGGDDLRAVLRSTIDALPNTTRAWADAISALADLSTGDAELVEVARLAGPQSKILEQVLPRVINGVSMSALFELLADWPGRTDSQRGWLRGLAAADHPWTDDDARSLIDAIFSTVTVDDLIEPSPVTNFLRAHTDTVIEALADRARQGLVQNPAAYLGLWVLPEEDRARAAAMSDRLAEHLDGLDDHVEAHPPRVPAVSRDEFLKRELDNGNINADAPVSEQRWPRDLTAAQRARLAVLADAWWPTQPISQIDRYSRDADRAAAALSAADQGDLEPSRERWLDAVGANDLIFQLAPGAFAWLARKYQPEWEPSVVDLIANVEDDETLVYVIASLPNALSERLVEALVSRLARSPAQHWWYQAIGLLCERGFTESLRPLLTACEDVARRDAVLSRLASAGDVDAQLHMLRRQIQRADAGETVAGISWHEPIRDARVVELLGELIPRLPYTPPREGTSVRYEIDPRAGAERLLADAESVAALAVYDRLIAAEPERHFDLARLTKLRKLVTLRVKARLPTSLADAAEVLRS